MQKQKYFSKILNLIMFSALLYLSLKVISCINSEQDMVQKLIKDKIPSNEITQNNLFSYKLESKNKILPRKEILCNSLLILNGSFAVLLAGFINWRNLLYTGTI